MGAFISYGSAALQSASGSGIVALRAPPNGLFQTAEVLPAVDFGKLAEVLVLEAPKKDAVPVGGED